MVIEYRRRTRTTEGGDNVIERNSIYTVRKSDTLGRYLVASRNINAGEKIIEEKALVVGPKNGSKIVCLGCYQQMNYSRLKETRCKGCKWPICGNKCAGLGAPYGHLLHECEILRQIEIEAKTHHEIEQLYNLITPLRCLLLKTHHLPTWRSLVTLESHNDIRNDIDDIWSFNQLAIVDPIRRLRLPAQFTATEIHTVCGILEVNAYEIGQGDISIRGLYPKSSLMAHDCLPNTSHIDYADFKMVIRSSIPIPKHRMITMNYTNTLDSTLNRRENLKKSKFFDCACERCKDPTELGTFMSALKCPICHHGNVLPIQPLDSTSIWQCLNQGPKLCAFQMKSSDVQHLIQKIKHELRTIDMNNIETLEQMLKKYCKILHENHSICLEIKYGLSQLYGKMSAYIINEMPNHLLERKRDICLNLLTVFDIIDPGLSRLRGITLYELHAPIMILALRKFETKQLAKLELKTQIEKVRSMLNEVVRILKNESIGSSEKVLSEAADSAVMELRQWNKFLKSK